jgi:hypothetical protein
MRVAELLVAEPAGAGVVGVEREYRVVRASDVVDFRALLPTLRLRGGGLDPGDPLAHHLPSGTLITADGPEAEVATPPVPLAPGCTSLASRWAEHGEDLLVAALPSGTGIEGYSTHLNVSVRGDVVEIAALFAARFALGMMLLLDRRDSPGLLVRPRPGRLELGGDFVGGEQLRAALTFAAAGARRCEEAVGARRIALLPPAARARVRTVTDRPGWYVPRDAFGPDLYDAGRGAEVRVGRRTVAAGAHLATTWGAARGALTDLASPAELELVDDIIRGHRPIPLEGLAPADPNADAAHLDSPFARLHRRDRDGLRVAVVAMSWAAVAFAVETPEGPVHVLVPRRWLGSFLRCVDDGTIVYALEAGRPDEPPARGPRVITSGFDPRCVLPREPRMRSSLWRHRRPELIGIAAGGAAGLAALGWRGW